MSAQSGSTVTSAYESFVGEISFHRACANECYFPAESVDKVCRKGKQCFLCVLGTLDNTLPCNFRLEQDL